MKNLAYWLAIIMLATINLNGYGQSEADKKAEKEARKEARKMDKASRKNEEEQRLIENYRNIEASINDSAFVIETHTLYDRRNLSYPVSPGTNFVMVEGDKFTMQIASNSGMGLNGLGGVTLEGRITTYKVQSKTGGPAKVKIVANTISLGSTTIMLNVNRSGNTRANVTGGFGQKISFSGDFAALEESHVFKGSTTY